MVAKTERITILVTPQFKSLLNDQAISQNISVSELVRRRCEQPTTDQNDAALFDELVATLHQAVDEAETNFDRGLRVANDVLAELRAKRTGRRPDEYDQRCH